MPLPSRLDALPSRELPGGVRLMAAETVRSRLLGLMGLPALDGDDALLLSPCGCIHTFGMRFPLDLVWLDAAGRVLRVDAVVAPGRVRGCRRARAVVETSAGAGERVAAALTAASDQRRLLLRFAGAPGAPRGLLDEAGAEGRRASQLPEFGRVAAEEQ